jgi:thiol-disulfide isomerase/thioredoxin
MFVGRKPLSGRRRLRDDGSMAAAAARSRRARRIGAAFVLALAGCGAPAHESGPPAARRILERAAAALAATRTVEYDFVFGHADDPMGHATGHTRMRRVTDAHDGWLRVTGEVHAQPRFGRAGQRFDYGLDAERARLADLTAGTYAEAPRGAGANALATNAVYGYLTEFIEAAPLWKELGSAMAIDLAAPETIDGLTCDVIRTIYQVQGKRVEVTWSISRADGLPRRGRWIDSSYVAGTMTFTLTGLRRGHQLSAADFVPERAERLADSAAPSGVVTLGQTVPDWELDLAEGGRLGSEALRGRIVVLDFWNTWCFVCRAIAPETRALERELRAQGVRFVGVNVFETGDAPGYWRGSGADYPTVLRGEELAVRLDVPSQPGIAVLDEEGRLRYLEVGATAERTARIRAAILAIATAESG